MDTNWSTNQKPNEYSSYDHCGLDTPLGEYLIEWKSWKDSPDYGVTLKNEYIGTEYSLEEAKALAVKHLRNTHTSLGEFLEKIA